jgi:tetratricopeptide (TPR) repeat protein
MSTNTETIEDDRIVAKCYVELGNVTKEKGEYDESLRYHRKSLEIFERIDDALSVADSHLNIAEIYKAKGEFKRAMSEYEKGLTLYEDVYVDDANKNSDSGTDVSLNSSSFSDLQHTKLISKSDETLPQTALINTNQKDISHSSLHLLNDVMNASTKKINEFNGVSQSIDDSYLISSEKLTSERRKSPSTSSISDPQYINANDMFLPLSPVEFVYQTTDETTPDESDILEIDLLSLHSIKQDYSKLIAEPSSLDKNLEDTNNNNNDVSLSLEYLSIIYLECYDRKVP